MDNVRLCVALVDKDIEAVKTVTPWVDFFEIRIDLIGVGWQELTGHLVKPWIACNRRREEGGNWRGSEQERTDELLKAVELGADIVDIELSTPGVVGLVGQIKGRAECLLSYHNLELTPPLEEMKDIVRQQRHAGAEICKVVTTAHELADNIAVLELIREFPDLKVVSFAMGWVGQLSRVLCPLAGGYYTYASVGEGRESADGQLPAKILREIYRLVKG
ncbi:MAG TPA: type I 3-dehydroquinate dehydratase [Dehalococcoidia bacterium]|nr:type I 3-dehydroquinate dehydratase [Dehalococcoidia bacterium]